MTTTALDSLIALQIRILSASVPYVHTQKNIEARVAFAHSLLPTLDILDKHYFAGDRLRAIIAHAVSADHYDLADLGSQAQVAIDGYRARFSDLQSDAYTAYVDQINRYNDNYRYSKRVKQKVILSKDAFLAKLPTI
jgi:hypothetical protein